MKLRYDYNTKTVTNYDNAPEEIVKKIAKNPNNPDDWRIEIGERVVCMPELTSLGYTSYEDYRMYYFNK